MTESQGEKELILGNKQLISLFFVVVALCGVCFAMGYIIGRNSSKPAVAAENPAAAPGQTAEPPRETAETPAQQPSPSAAPDNPAVQPDASSPAQPQTSVIAEQPVTQPGRDIAEPRRAKAPEPAPTPVKAAPAATASMSGGGSYLQVGAVSKPDAENLVRTLREQKLPALMSESPRKGLFRVLVGPYRQVTDVAEAKSRLKTLGFDNAFVQR